MKQGKPYFELVASILYASAMTRPDIACHTSMLCRFMQSPSVDCSLRAKELFNYLSPTKDKTLVLGDKNIFVLTSSRCSTLEQRRSTPTISRSKLQATMASTSTLKYPGRPTTPTLRT
eukprot:6196709-Pleurochrysis_carterae.AAC.2